MFGTEVIIPLDIGLPILQAEYYDQPKNEVQLWANLDLLEGTRERASVCVTDYQQKIARYYNSRVKNKAFRVGDPILRRVEIS